MKILNIKNLLLSISAALILSACGGDGSEGSLENDSIVLELNEPILVYAGDSLEKSSEDTTVNIVHDLTNDTKTVTLLTGSATLIRGGYTLDD